MAFGNTKHDVFDGLAAGPFDPPSQEFVHVCSKRGPLARHRSPPKEEATASPCARHCPRRSRHPQTATVSRKETDDDLASRSIRRPSASTFRASAAAAAAPRAALLRAIYPAKACSALPSKERRSR